MSIAPPPGRKRADMLDRQSLPSGCQRIDVRINPQGDVRVFPTGDKPSDEWLPAVLTVEGWKARRNEHAG